MKKIGFPSHLNFKEVEKRKQRREKERLKLKGGDKVGTYKRERCLRNLSPSLKFENFP